MTVASVMTNMIFPKMIFDEIIHYELYSNATPSFIPPHTITISALHFISTKNDKNQQPTHTETPSKTKTSLDASKLYTNT